MANISVGDIVFVHFPFSDLSKSKLRPALVLADAEKGDLILFQITSQSIFPELEKDSFVLAAELATEIRKYLDRALDVIVVDESNFDKRSRETWTLEHTIKSEGIAV